MINLKSGTYYSLADAGAVAWQLLEAGATAEEAAVAIGDRYRGDSAEIAAAVAALAESLLAEGLIVEQEPGETAAEPAALPPPPEGELPPFAAPKLEPYIDMQNLIQLDPVHETDERGWPTSAAQ